MSAYALAAGDPDRIRARYPERVWCDGELIEVRAHADGEAPAGGGEPRAVIADADAAAASRWLNRDVPLLLAPATAWQLHTEGADLTAARWACWSPAAFAPEVVAARQTLADGRLGALLGGDVVVPFGLGLLDDARWEPDAGCALDTLEAVAIGLDLLRQLGLPRPTRAGGTAPSPGAEPALRHDLGDGVGVTHRLCDAADLPVPGFRAELRGTRGRILLRAEMAPGALTVWDNASRTLRCPALPRTKPTIQSPDTARGGAETAQQLTELAAGRTPSTSELGDTVDLLHHAARCADQLDRQGARP